jgi:hypothetical protein
MDYAVSILYEMKWNFVTHIGMTVTDFVQTIYLLCRGPLLLHLKGVTSWCDAVKGYNVQCMSLSTTIAKAVFFPRQKVHVGQQRSWSISQLCACTSRTGIVANIRNSEWPSGTHIEAECNTRAQHVKCSNRYTYCNLACHLWGPTGLKIRVYLSLRYNGKGIFNTITKNGAYPQITIAVTASFVAPGRNGAYSFSRYNPKTVPYCWKQAIHFWVTMTRQVQHLPETGADPSLLYDNGTVTVSIVKL